MDQAAQGPLRHTRACIDLDAIDHNLNILSTRVPGVKLMPAVKSDAYGHGLVPVAQTAERFGVEMLAVATAEEFLILRDQGLTVPVLILGELFPEEAREALQQGARFAAGSREYARFLSDCALRLGVTARVHLNVDTGMGRLGLFSADPLQDLLDIAALPALHLEGLFSHFASSDEGDLSFSQEQLHRFQDLLQGADRAKVPIRYRHIANSGALIDFPSRSSYDLVRPGIAVYGIHPSDQVSQEMPLRPALRVVSRLVKITSYDRSWTVGYGRTWRVKAGTTVGVVPIGYGDGYPRALSNRGEVLIHGRRVPVMGRVSMDAITLDLTSIASRVRRGDEVVLLGDGIGAGELARLTGTIPYEITCGLSVRLPRVYLRGGRITAWTTQREGFVTGDPGEARGGAGAR
ncbi:alanine racemase [Alkalispirochaeta americana]|uniref:Alanine racemase n=1 Tax=Alkalispirochaeta americana TaxID=159291 RepID=A0A1N6TIJ5_9SPIO|nr:alanine racemase [Alkalispirochaeta americana]SIQ53067.1 alanine racemase [Alkalispirochaeta americana]